MKRTTVMLPPALKARAERAARERGISLGELVRQSLAADLARPSDAYRASDPLFGDVAVHEGDVPEDLASEHDRYLYDERGTG